MAADLPPVDPALEQGFYRLYRTFFDRAEKKRRWSLCDDIPWERIDRSPDPAVADVVESFWAVEMYLPDYLARAMSIFRASRGKLWFYANWGYEESKHSLALGDWLLRSRARTDEQMADLEGGVFTSRWDLPYDDPVAMLAYAAVQELATGLNYRNLRRRVGARGDPALSRLLGFIRVDEQAHHRFFLDAVRLYLDRDRAGTLRKLHRVLHTFAMPALHLLADSRRRVERIKGLEIFDERIYFAEVYQPILAALGVSRPELRRAV